MDLLKQILNQCYLLAKLKPTLAVSLFCLSIIALILAFVAYNRTSGEANFKAQISDLQAKMKTLKAETSEKITKAAKALEKIGIEIKKEESKKNK